MTVTATTPIELVESVYATLPDNANLGRERLGRPLTLAEKILINHLVDPAADVDRGVTYNDLTPTVLRCRTPPPRWRCCSS
jgi:aconitate hydratase